MGFFADLFKKFPSTILSRDPASRFGRLFKVIAEEFDEVRTSIDLFETIRDIEASTGVNLDQIGVIIKETRKGKNDEDYRVALYIAALRDRTKGTVPEIIQIARLISNDQFFKLIPGFLLQGDVLDGAELLNGLGILDPGDLEQPAHYKLLFEGQIATVRIPSDLKRALELISGAGISHQLEADLFTDLDTLPDLELEIVVT